MEDGYSTAGYVKGQLEAQCQIAAQLTRIADALEAQYLLTVDREWGLGESGRARADFLHDEITGRTKAVTR